jgi:hypothetical protein
MQVGCLAMVCAALTACDTKESAQFKAGLTLQRRLAEIAGQANGAAPAVVDPNTRLDGARAGPGLRLTVMYTLVNAESDGVDSATFEPLLTPTIKENGCANPDLRPLIDQGVVVVLEYRGKGGDPIGTVNINRATCGASSDPRTGTGPVNAPTATSMDGSGMERKGILVAWHAPRLSPRATLLLAGDLRDLRRRDALEGKSNRSPLGQ